MARRRLHICTAHKGPTLPIDTVTETFGILGVRGSGKTTTAKKIVEELTLAGQQCVILDPLGVWWGLKSSADGKSAGLPFVVLGGDHGDLPLTPQSGELIADLVIQENVPIVVDLSHMRKGDQRHWVMEFAERLYHSNREALHLVVDEVDLFAPQRPIKGAERLLGAMEDLVRRGRARGIGVSAITQRSASVHKDILSQVSTLVVHRLVGPQDRKAIDDWVEANGTKEQRDELMASVASLPTGTAWFWSPSWLGVFEKVEVRLPDTFDSSATPKAGQKRIEPKAFAKIDLTALESQMAEVVAEAEKTDPKLLQRQLTEARRELQARERELEAERHRKAAPAPQTAAAPEVVSELVRELVTQPVGVVPEGLRAAALATAEGLESAAEGLRESADVQARGLRAAAAGFVSQAKLLRQAVAQADRLEGKPVGDPVSVSEPVKGSGGSKRGVKASVPVGVSPEPPSGSSTATRPAAVGLARPAPVAAHRVAADADDGAPLGAGARRMLEAAKRSHPRRLTFSQMLMMAKMKRSGTSNGYLKTLLRRGLLVEDADKTLALTEAGFAEVGLAVPDEPLSQAEMLAMWRGTLQAGAQRMFDVLVDRYPGSLSRDELIDAAGLTPSGTSNGYVKTMERANLVTVEDGQVRAADSLFDDALAGV